MDYLYLDLSETTELCGLSAFWSFNRFNLISFRRQDYLPGSLPLDQQVRKAIVDLGGTAHLGPTRLLTTPRRLGHCMNPISLFYCFDDADAKDLKYVLAEVHNTPWDERHVYLLKGPNFEQPTIKDFHVSPFMPMNTSYNWEISDPNKSLRVAIKVSQGDAPMFTATMNLKKQEISSQTIARITWRQFCQAFKTISAIYFQAAKLMLKKVPFFSHPDKIKLQESN